MPGKKPRLECTPIPRLEFPMDIRQSIKKQNYVSIKLATHLLSNKYPDSNAVFSPLSIQQISNKFLLNLLSKRLRTLLIKLFVSKSISRTRLIFANAIYFKGAWRDKFYRSETKKYDFHLIDGSKVQVPFMTTWKGQLIHEYDGFKVLGLPYSHGKDKRRFTMYFFLPDAEDGLASLVEKMGSESDFLDHHIPTRGVKVGQFMIPKFKMSFWLNASKMLKELGLVFPFSEEESNLTGMVDSLSGENLYVSSIHQKAFVEVNEEVRELQQSRAHGILMFPSILWQIIPSY